METFIVGSIVAVAALFVTGRVRAFFKKWSRPRAGDSSPCGGCSGCSIVKDRSQQGFEWRRGQCGD